MSLRLDIEPGGEKFFVFAKQKLREMKTWMKQAGLRTLTRFFWTSNSDRIWINSIRLSAVTSLDWIRIEAGGGWDFFFTVATKTLWKLSAASGIGPISMKSASRILDKAFGFTFAGGPLASIDDKGVSKSMHAGVLDTYSIVSTFSGDNDVRTTATLTEPAALFAPPSGLTRVLASPTQMITIAGNSTLSRVKLTAIQDNAYYIRDASSFGGGDPAYHLEGFGLDGSTYSTGHLDWKPLPGSTFRDAYHVINSWDGNVPPPAVGNVDVYSIKRNQLVATFPRAMFLFGATDFLPSVCTKNAYHVFGMTDYLGGEDIPGAVDVTQISCMKVEENYDAQGIFTGYTQSLADVNITSQIGLGSTNLFPKAVVATKDYAWAIFTHTLDDGFGVITFFVDFVRADGQLTSVSLGVTSDISSIYPEDAIPQYGATIDKPWVVLHSPKVAGTPRTVRFISPLGVEQTFTGLGSAAFATTLSLWGNTRDVLYAATFVSSEATPLTRHLFGSDGSITSLTEDAAAAGNTRFVTFFPNSPITKKDKIYGFFLGTFAGLDKGFHITQKLDNLDPIPDAAEVFVYPVALTPTAPIRSQILPFQEFEAWA